MSIVMGQAGHLYLGYPVPGATELISLARDVVASAEDREVETTGRTNRFATFRPGLRDLELTFEIEYDPALPQYQLLRDVWIAAGNIEFYVLDGKKPPLPGDVTQGFRFSAKIMAFSRFEPMDGSMRVAVKARPTDQGEEGFWIEPEWHIDGP